MKTGFGFLVLTVCVLTLAWAASPGRPPGFLTPESIRITLESGQSLSAAELDRAAVAAIREKGGGGDLEGASATMSIRPGHPDRMCTLMYGGDFSKPSWNVFFGYDGRVTACFSHRAMDRVGFSSSIIQEPRQGIPASPDPWGNEVPTPLPDAVTKVPAPVPSSSLPSIDTETLIDFGQTNSLRLGELRAKALGALREQGRVLDAGYSCSVVVTVAEPSRPCVIRFGKSPMEPLYEVRLDTRGDVAQAGPYASPDGIVPREEVRILLGGTNAFRGEQLMEKALGVLLKQGHVLEPDTLCSITIMVAEPSRPCTVTFGKAFNKPLYEVALDARADVVGVRSFLARHDSPERHVDRGPGAAETRVPILWGTVEGEIADANHALAMVRTLRQHGDAEAIRRWATNFIATVPPWEESPVYDDFFPKQKQAYQVFRIPKQEIPKALAEIFSGEDYHPALILATAGGRWWIKLQAMGRGFNHGILIVPADQRPSAPVLGETFEWVPGIYAWYGKYGVF